MALFSAIAVSCEVDEVTDAPAADALVHKVFHATIEEDGLTKTMLDETAVDGVRGMLWDPGDVIGIGIQGSTFRKFTNVVAEPTANGVFEGDINEENTYYAIYPWQENKTMTTELTVDIPSRQTYRANSFDINMAPMVGKGNNGESIHFQNLCGILAISMKGTDVIKSISLTAKDVKGNKAFISGQFSVDMGYETFPYPMPTEQSLTNVTIDCGDGVQLDSEKETYFHILLPPGTYYGLDLLITTDDARFMTLSTDKTLTVKRSVLTKTSSLEFMENVGEEMITDLSLRGNSNCYIVPSEGIYSFDATIIGNGKFGIIPGAGFHTDTPEITPASVELLWEDRAGLIQGYVYDPSEGRVKLVASATEGNALIAAKDADGTILWSWHIWATDAPIDQKYVNSAGTFTVQDRNLGATRADRGTGDEWKEGKGTLYQWGRKDPIIRNLYTLNTVAWEQFSIERSIQNPTLLPKANSNMSWWMKPEVGEAWSSTQKTIYDPCPAGYRVADKEVWSGFTKEDGSLNTNGEYNNGWNFIVNDLSSGNIAWYPANDIIGYSGSYYKRTDETDLWYASSHYSFHIDQNQVVQDWFEASSASSFSALHTRCMKDEGHVDVSTYIEVASPAISEVTTNSAMLSSTTKYGASLNVTDKGFIVGTTSDLSDGKRISCGAGLGAFTYELSDLTSTTRYYVQSYVEFENEICYSDVRKFTTKFSGDAVDLSADGTANCYIAPFAGQFAFNSLYKGNSSESVGEPTSAEVVWETTNTTNNISQGDVITSVEFLSSGLVLFETSGIEGNALIAVKDVDGVILWSWHIWVTDYDIETTAQTYQSGAVMMDRNLGALNINHGDALSFGLFYQYGRKDPFIGCGSTSSWSFATTVPAGIIRYESNGSDEFAVRNPNIVTQNLNSEWASEKSIHDPCPPGWRVPDVSVWSGFSASYRSDVTYGYVFTAPLAIPDAYYPRTGDTENGNQRLRNPGSNCYLWSTTSGYAYNLVSLSQESRSRYDENPVRCMKE